MIVLLTGLSTLASVLKLALLLILFFGILAAAHFFTRWYVKSGAAGSAGTKNIAIVESQQISSGRNIVIARIGEKYVAFVLFKENAVFLTELSEDELDFTKAQSPVSGQTFQELLKKAKNFKQKESR